MQGVTWTCRGLRNNISVGKKNNDGELSLRKFP